MTRIGDPITVQPVLAPHRQCNHYTFDAHVAVVRKPPPAVVVKGLGR